MINEITIALIGISSALLGTIIGGFITYFSNKTLKTLEWENPIKRQDLNERKVIYSNFLAEVNNLALEAHEEKTRKASYFNSLANCMTQLELSSNDSVIEATENIADHVFSLYIKDEKSPGDFPALRKTFAEAVRAERDELTKNK